jgi:hypothetical protein
VPIYAPPGGARGGVPPVSRARYTGDAGGGRSKSAEPLSSRQTQGPRRAGWPLGAATTMLLRGQLLDLTRQGEGERQGPYGGRSKCCARNVGTWWGFLIQERWTGHQCYPGTADPSYSTASRPFREAEQGCPRGKGARHSGHAKAGRAAGGGHNERCVGMRKGCIIRRSWTAGCAERCLPGAGESWNETSCREAARRFLRLTSG